MAITVPRADKSGFVGGGVGYGTVLYCGFFHRRVARASARLIEKNDKRHWVRVRPLITQNSVRGRDQRSAVTLPFHTHNTTLTRTTSPT